MSVLKMSEATLQDGVIELAHIYGFMVHHDLPSQRATGAWSTLVSGDVGFPDLVLAKAGRVIFAELKSERGALSVPQMDWQRELGAGVEYYVWKPTDWNNDTIEKILRAKVKPVPTIQEKPLEFAEVVETSDGPAVVVDPTVHGSEVSGGHVRCSLKGGGDYDYYLHEIKRSAS